MSGWMNQLSDDQLALLACGALFAVSMFSMFLSVPLRNLFTSQRQESMNRFIRGQLPDAPSAKADFQASVPREKAA